MHNELIAHILKIYLHFLYAPMALCLDTDRNQYEDYQFTCWKNEMIQLKTSSCNIIRRDFSSRVQNASLNKLRTVIKKKSNGKLLHCIPHTLKFTYLSSNLLLIGVKLLKVEEGFHTAINNPFSIRFPNTSCGSGKAYISTYNI
jgi:hypothetical protein